MIGESGIDTALWHHDGIFTYTTAPTGTTASITGLYVYNNYFYGTIPNAITAYIYVSQSPGTIPNCYVFNNTTVNTTAAGYTSPAALTVWCDNATVVNNTVIGRANSDTGGGCILTYVAAATVENNICDTGKSGVGFNTAAAYGLSDYNDLFNVEYTAAKGGTLYRLLCCGPLTWQADPVAPDPHSTASDPNLNKNSTNPPYQLSNNTSPAYRTGANLFATCNGQPNPGLGALCTGADGNARPNGAWDMGADFLTTPIALVQRVPTTNETACSSTSATCSITVAATGAGHAGVLTYAGHPGVYINSVSTDGSWTVPTGCKASASSGATSCAYNLSLTGGATTETVTLNTASPGTYGYLSFHEVSSTGTFAFDAAGAVTDSTSSLSLAGAGLSLTGSDDFIVQTWRVAGGSASSVTSPYIDLTGFGSFSAYALSINTSSGAAPTLTMTLPTTGVAGAIALSVH
jgi:hypothetical protein